MKVNTISLNSVRLNTIALNHIGEIRSGGGGSKPSPIPQWIREHISFYYDMSKPMDVYHTNFTKWVKGSIGNAIGKQTENEIILNGRRNEGDTTLGYLVTDKSLFLTKGDLIKVEGASNEAKIKVIVQKNDNQWVNAFNGIDEIVSDGIYEFSLTPINYKGIQIEITGVTTYSNLKITLLPSGKSVPTNEILKVSGYLQDLSGRKRNMKLNNFLFDMMSGVDGYKNESFETVPGNTNIKWKHLSYYSIQGKPTQKSTDFGLYRVKNNANKSLYLKWNIEGIQEGNKVYLAQYNNESTRIELTNGVSDIALDTTNSDNPGYSYVVIISDQPYSTDITITQIPEYPGALVTDGVDDYGLVENLSSGVKMLFMTVNPMKIDTTLYDQRKVLGVAFSIYNRPDTIAYNSSNPEGSTYIDGELNESIRTNSLLDTKQVITIVNDTVSIDNTRAPFFFKNTSSDKYAKMAFYNSISFDSIPTEADGFTEQELIDYVLTNIIGQ
jgi:hypothetical protein